MPENLPSNSGGAGPIEPQSGTKRRPNAPLWLGFLIVLFAFLSYIPIFAKYPITRDMPWANFLIFVVGFILLFAAHSASQVLSGAKLPVPFWLPSASRLWSSSASPYFL